MRLFFHAHAYASHARVAAEYLQLLLRAGCVLVANPSDADVCFIHDEPQNYARVLANFPRTYRVAFAVYEATPLPEEHRRGIALVDEIWTPSDFCCALFAPHHGRVFIVPHVVERDLASDASVLDAFRLRGDKPRFLHIGRGFDRRKGTAQLLRVFGELHRDAELIWKSVPQDAPVSFPGVTQIRYPLTDAQIAALYSTAHAYVSPHHGEGWGLTLSDALFLGKRTIATDWSGNVDFMRGHPLSILVPAQVETIHETDRYAFFRAEQQWAYVSDEDLLLAMKAALQQPAKAPPSDQLQRFSRDAVFSRVAERVRQWPLRR